MVDLKELFATEYGHSESDSMKVQGLGEIPHPATCFICGSGNCEAGYMNTGIWHDYVGNLLICIPDLIKMAEKAGCLAPSVNELIQDSSKELVAANQELTEQNEKLNGKVASLRAALVELSADNPTTVNPSGSPHIVLDEKPKTVDDVLTGTSSVSDGQQSVDAESVKVSGPSNSEQSTSVDLTESPSGPEL